MPKLIGIKKPSGMQILNRTIKAIALMLAGGLLACSDLDSSSTSVAKPELTAELKQGQLIWDKTCRVCHLNGVAEAPVMGNKKAWAPRIAKGETLLIEHAINGFAGDKGSMPARGGNTDLTDEQVGLAVKYMLFNSQ